MMSHEIIYAAQQNWIVGILIFPLLGFLFNGLGYMIFRERFPRWLSNWSACLTVAASFIFTVMGFYLLSQEQPEAYYYQKVFGWLAAGDFKADFGLMFDHLSAIMCLTVTLVGLLIHIYATGYMAHDPGYARFFSYMNLFMFMMLTLVLADNLVLMFVGWEGVGLCSYLLIGFWYEDWDKAKAGLKAFIVNRIGDLGFLLGIFTLFLFLHTVEFAPMKNWIETHIFEFNAMQLYGIKAATLAGILLFIGACGKSAQLPLYVWLPDAMAGPTPVSALIHAATMVTAGVYMIGRLSFVYVNSPLALTVVAFVGALTALYAGTIGLTQTDIKRVLAYSTISQLGFMFLAMGSMAFSAGIFHLFTHAFFKALLFLGAGSVIVAFHHKEQDITKMGGLRHYMPWTYRTVLIAFLAIIGMPPLAGFWSKDEILFRTMDNSNKLIGQYHLNYWLWCIGVLAALVTGIYMTRWMILIFYGKSRVDEEAKNHLMESPRSMIIPLLILALGSALVGFLGVPEFMRLNNLFANWLEPAFAKAEIIPAAFLGSESLFAVLLMLTAVGAGILGLLVAMYLFVEHPEKAEEFKQMFHSLWKVSYNKYYVDEIYDYSVVKPLLKGSYYFLFRFIDVLIIDGFMNGLAWLNATAGRLARRLQNGAVSTYLFYFVAGALAVEVYLGVVVPPRYPYNSIYMGIGIAFGVFVLLASLLMGILEK